MVGNIKLSRQSPSKFADVERIYIHEEYDTDGRRFDVALLKVWLRLIITIFTWIMETRNVT